ncbi:MAG TPA: hypothetical protein QF646_01560 [Candidatus Poseidoniales archaeon]|nr:hypothetical protein [Candidatus Poseidoniales archaeon]
MATKTSKVSEEEDEVEFVEVGGRLIERSTLERARRAAITAAAIRAKVTPRRIVAATFVLFLILASFGAAVYYLIPYDRTRVDVVFSQSAAGHVVLAEIVNGGSRSIENVVVELRFTQSSSEEALNSTMVNITLLTAHQSAAGDDLELLIEGVSGWESYLVSVTMTYIDAAGNTHEISEVKQVGDWQMESWSVEEGLRLLI